MYLLASAAGMPQSHPSTGTRSGSDMTHADARQREQAPDTAGDDLGTADTPSDDALRCAFNGRVIRPGPLVDLMSRRGTQRIVIDMVAHNAVSGASDAASSAIVERATDRTNFVQLEVRYANDPDEMEIHVSSPFATWLEGQLRDEFSTEPEVNLYAIVRGKIARKYEDRAMDSAFHAWEEIEAVQDGLDEQSKQLLDEIMERAMVDTCGSNDPFAEVTRRAFDGRVIHPRPLIDLMKILRMNSIIVDTATSRIVGHAEQAIQPVLIQLFGYNHPVYPWEIHIRLLRADVFDHVPQPIYSEYLDAVRSAFASALRTVQHASLARYARRRAIEALATISDEATKHRLHAIINSDDATEASNHASDHVADDSDARSEDESIVPDQRWLDARDEPDDGTTGENRLEREFSDDILGTRSGGTLPFPRQDERITRDVSRRLIDDITCFTAFSTSCEDATCQNYID
ncbi:hypothetical protein SeLEV6574_g08389 [Synchytrium endobioticum]|uniref:Uncharacterized protein n=1 Tax=Synchytrium endobioticum TaxID=286115 RepID=A0A507C725_9FUNG|nr:hypothetical protein SeLEV6574_g08389 [Synchytrium endobioticum]